MTDSESESIGGYSPTESFESGRVTAVSADESRVAIGTETGNVDVVSAEDRTTVALDAPITDLAVGNRVYALADDTVTALSSAGTRVWSVDLPAARQLAALPGADVLGVVTDDDRLVGFDGETGRQAFDEEQPYADVTDDPGFFGTDGAFVLTAWSFLAVRNLDGTERFDRNLDGAIESAGIVDDTVVVSLKDERVVGVHATTGESQWERELSVTDLPDRGDDVLLFSADDQLVSLSADGSYATVEELPAGDVSPASDGSLFCAISSGTVTVYCANGDPVESLSVSVADDELVPSVTDTLDLDVRNEGDRPVTATLRADCEGVTLGERVHSVDLEPGESATWTLPVEEVATDEIADDEVTAEEVTAEDEVAEDEVAEDEVADDEVAEEEDTADEGAIEEKVATLTVEADDDLVESLSLSIIDRAGAALVADAELAAIDDGVATFEVTASNEGPVPLTGVTASPGDAHLGRLAPDESVTATVEAAVEPGVVVPISVGSDDEATDLEETVPRDGVEVGVETAPDGFVDVRVENGTDARLADDLVVAGNCFDARLERRVELPERGALVLALRPDSRPGTVSVEATLAGLGVGQSAEFAPENVDARYTDTAGSGRTGRSASERTNTSASGRTDTSGGRSPGRSAGGSSSESGRGSSGRSERSASGRSERSSSGRSASDSSDSPTTIPSDSPTTADSRASGDDASGRTTGEIDRVDAAETDRGDATGRSERRDVTETERRDTTEADRPTTDKPDRGDATDRGGADRGETTSRPDRRSEATGQSDRGDAGNATGTGTAGPELSAERTVETAEPARTQVVRERLAVVNEGGEPAEDVAVELPDGTMPVGTIRPGDRATVERRHAFGETGEVTLPTGTVTAANAPDASVAKRTLTVERGELVVEVSLADDEDGAGDEDGDRFRATLTNHRDAPCEVDRIGVREIGVWDAEDCRVPPGQTVEWTRTVDSLPSSVETFEAAVEYAFADGGPGRWTTLGRVTDDAAADSEGVAGLAAAVGEETRVSGGYGSVVLVVENQSQSPVSDVAVEASGDEVSDLMYGGRESVEELGPGDQFSHFVDVETEGPKAAVSVALSVGEDTETELTLRGPAPSDEGDWSAEVLDAWQVGWGNAEASDGSDHVVTEFERT